MTTTDFSPVDITSVYDEVADFFASAPSAEQIADFRLSEASERLISNLLETNRTRGLTPAEKESLDDYTRIERLMQSIKVKVLAKKSAEVEQFDMIAHLLAHPLEATDVTPFKRDLY